MAEFQRRWGKKSSVHSLENEVPEVAEGGRPPKTEAELRRLIDYLADPVAFAAWFERLMGQTDPTERA